MVQSLSIMNVADFAALMKQTLFADLEAKHIAALHSMCECRLASSGECIRQVGEMADALAIVATGRVRLVDPTRRETLAHFSAGQAFGLISLLFPGQGYVEVYAVEETTLVILDAGNLRMIEVSNPELAIVVNRAVRSALAPIFANALPVLAKML